MLPKRPHRPGQVGFLYLPPYRIQGISVAGEETCVQVPELDIAFDIGMCPRPVLSAPFIALSHGHMDHLGGLPYYFSQRHFLKMGPGTCVCHHAVAPALESMMQAWIPLEDQRTPHTIIGIEPGGEVPIKHNVHLTAIGMSHTVPALGYAIVERRSKLREEFHNLPQSRLRELKAEGVDITRTLEFPLVAYTGDTETCPGLFDPLFAEARIVVAECTFFDPGHRSRSKVGKHLHVDDLVNLLNVWKAEHVVIVHVSRRTHIGQARTRLIEALGEEVASRVHFLMDHRTNRERYDAQCAAAEAAAAAAHNANDSNTGDIAG